MVKSYLDWKSFDFAMEAFEQRFPGRNPHSKIFRNVEKYLRNGPSENLCEGRSGRSQPVRNN